MTSTIRLRSGRILPTDLVEGYELHSHAGDGAFGHTFIATQLKFPRIIVIKIPKQASSFNDALLREIERTASLRHPSIVTIFDTGRFRYPGSATSLPYYAMERLEGVLGTGFIQLRSRLTLRQNASLFLGLCDAILYAHDHGVFHCDLHSQNIMIIGNPPSGAKIIDFGFPSQYRERNVAGGSHELHPGELDYTALRDLWERFFAFPDVNGLAAGAVAGASTLSALRDAVARLLDTRFSDADVLDASGELSNVDKAEREVALANVALHFVKDHVVPGSITVSVKAWQPDLACS